MPSFDHCRQHPSPTVGFVELCVTLLLLLRHGLDLQHHPAAPLERSPTAAYLHPASGTAPTTRLQPPSAPWSGTLLRPDSGTTATASASRQHHQLLSGLQLHHELHQQHTASKQYVLRLCSTAPLHLDCCRPL